MFAVLGAGISAIAVHLHVTSHKGAFPVMAKRRFGGELWLWVMFVGWVLALRGVLWRMWLVRAI